MTGRAIKKIRIVGDSAEVSDAVFSSRFIKGDSVRTSNIFVVAVFFPGSSEVNSKMRRVHTAPPPNGRIAFMADEHDHFNGPYIWLIGRQSCLGGR